MKTLRINKQCLEDAAELRDGVYVLEADDIRLVAMPDREYATLPGGVELELEITRNRKKLPAWPVEKEEVRL